MIHITIGDIPPSLNRFAGRQNSWEYRAEKDKWTNLVRLLGRSQKPPEPFERATVHIHYTFPDRRRRDPDNYAGKVLLDGLTKAGIIADDSFSHIKLMLSAGVENKVKRTEIIVEELKC